MPSLKFFEHTGLLVIPDFLDADQIGALRTEMLIGLAERARVEKPGGIDCVDEAVRKTGSIEVSKRVASDIKSRLLGLMPRLEQHFNRRLAGCEPPSFLIYDPSDFFIAHADGGDFCGRGKGARRRRVSAVIFLNEQSSEPAEGAYGRGELTFHGLLEGPHWERCAFPLPAEPGLLVAFPAEMIHEVSAVSHGRRLTVVTWFYAAEPAKSEVLEAASS